MAHIYYDILKTIGGRYLVVRTNDNTPMAPSFATRTDAEAKLREIEATLYDWPMDAPTAEEKEGSGDTREQMQRKVEKGDKQVGSHPLNKAEVS